MSKALETQVEKLFLATRDLMSFEEIQPHCEHFNQWLASNTSYSQASLGTVLSRAGLYRKFKSISNLVPDKNAVSIPKKDGNGNTIGNELKHYVLTKCGLSAKEWESRNQSTRSTDRLENSTEIDPDNYLKVTGELLESDKPHELAVGIIAATGRRPHEIIMRAKFTAIPDKPYHVMFEGQGKKRGEKPVFEIATLYPGEYIIKALSKLRKEPTYLALIEEVKTKFPKSVTKQNIEVDKRRNGSLNRVVRQYFGDKGDNNPVLNFRHGEEQDNCKALRASYSVIATERDCQGGVGSKLLYAAKLLGHITPDEEPSDSKLKHLTTTLGYSDYYTNKSVSFPNSPMKERLYQVRTTETDYETIKSLQEELKLPNQQELISKLLDFYHKGTKELFEAQNEIARLSKVISNMQDTQSHTTENNSTEELIERMIEQKLQTVLSKVLPSSNLELSTKVTNSTSPEVIKPKAPKESVEWETKSNEELWNSKVQGSAIEKIRRSYQAICNYNDTLATGDNDRLAITNQALRELSGTNGIMVGDWIKNHTDEIITHHSKYGMQNAKDPSKVETYYNKRHGKERIENILRTISDKFLDGQSFKN